MKKILIIGQNSYIGNSFGIYIKKYDGYGIEKISSRNNDWLNTNFSAFDVILFVAGIAHIKPTPDKKDLFFAINRDLSIEIAKKAKNEGVKQFIYMSSMNVFGDVAGRITKDTKPRPTSFYGQSKLEADEQLTKLNSESFKVVSIRPPMVYGKGCKGNYLRLSRISKKIPIFPKFYNERSMIHIYNLCEFIKLIIDNECCGIYYPQNKEFVCTSDMVKRIAEINGHNILLVPGFAWLIKLFIRRIGILNKVFGTETCNLEMSNNFNFEYCINDFNNTIKKTEL